MSSSESQRNCHDCGKPIPEDTSSGGCPHCLLGLMFDGKAEDPVAGEKFGDFILERTIARGGMGVVYQARQPSLNRAVALKMIVGGELATEEALLRFKIEAEATASIQHSGIVSIYDVGEIDSQPYLAMQLVKGKNLAESMPDLRLSDSGDNKKEIARLLSAVAQAVAYTHQCGILHRDIKPSNILINQEGNPLLSDFGLAKLLHSDQAALTLSTSALGSPNYMAPEQASGQSTIASDVWGIGAVMYELLTGQPPFRGKTAMETIRKVIDEPAVPPSRQRSGVDRDLETICLKCLEKQPGDRYATADDLVDDLERFVKGEPVTARPVSGFIQFLRWCRRNVALAALGVGLFLALAGGLVVSSIQRNRALSANAELLRSVQRFEWQEISNLLESESASAALAKLARRLRDNPGDWRAATFGVSILEEKQFAIPVGHSFGFDDGHEILDLSWNAEETLLAGHRRGNKIHRWDAKTGEELKPFPVPEKIVTMALSRDGRFFAVGLTNGEIRFLDSSGKEASTPKTLSSPPRKIVTLAEGRFAATSDDGIHIFSITDASSQFFELDGAPKLLVVSGAGRSLAFSSGNHVEFISDVFSPELRRFETTWNSRKLDISWNGDTIAALNSDRIRIRIWRNDDRENRELLLPLSQQEGATTVSFAVSPDGTKVAAGTERGGVVQWDVESGVVLDSPICHHFAIDHVVYDRKGNHLLTSSFDSTVGLWNAEGVTPVGEFVIHDRPVRRSDFLPKTEDFITHSGQPDRPKKYQRWKLTDPADNRVLGESLPHWFDAVDFSPDGKFIVLADNNSVRIVDTKTKQEVYAPLPVKASAILFTADSESVITVGNNGLVGEWNVRNAEKIRDIADLKFKTSAVTLNSDHSKLIVCGKDGRILAWDLKRNMKLWESRHDDFVSHAAFSPDGKFLLSSSSDMTVAVWNAATGERVVHFTGHKDKVSHAVWSPDGESILSGGYDFTALLWNAKTGKLICPPLPHRNQITWVSFAPGGKRIATACREGVSRIWEFPSGKPVGQPMRSRFAMRNAFFTSDERQLIGVSQGDLRHWDAHTSEAITVAKPMVGHTGIGYIGDSTIATSPDGWQLVTGTNGPEANLWDLHCVPDEIPKWLPEFFEAVARQQISTDGTTSLLPVQKFHEAVEWLPKTGFYAERLRKFSESED